MATKEVSRPQEANKGAAEVHASYSVLRESEEGRQSMIALMQDPEASVRCWAAAHCLQWRPEAARRVLEALRDSHGPFSFDAEMTLDELDKGRLSFG